MESNNSRSQIDLSQFDAKSFYKFMISYIAIGTVVTVTNKNIFHFSNTLGKDFVHVWFLVFLGSIAKIMFSLVFVLLSKISWLRRLCKSENENSYTMKSNSQETMERELTDQNAEQEAEIRITISNRETNFFYRFFVEPIQILPATICDICSWTFLSYALLFIPGSFFRMLTSIVVLYTTIFSKCFLRNSIFSHHYIGIFFQLSGIILVGVVTFGEKESLGIDSGWGFFLVLFGCLFTAFQFIFEENLVKNKKFSSVKIVAYEGIQGGIITLIFNIIFQFVFCKTPGPDEQNFAYYICNEDDNHIWRVEDSLFALRQLGSDGLLLLNVIIFSIFSALLVYTGIELTYYTTSGTRAVVDSLNSIFVWLIFLLPIFKQQEVFFIMQLVGYLIMVFGTLIYTEIIVIPFWNLDYNTRKQIEKRNISSYFNKLVLESNTY